MSSSPTCPTCGGDLVLEIDPDVPADEHAPVLAADPPFHYVCSSRCPRP